jgi:hypothetical protein
MAMTEDIPASHRSTFVNGHVPVVDGVGSKYLDVGDGVLRASHEVVAHIAINVASPHALRS